MFTGIIQATGEIRRVDERGGDRRLSVTSRALDMAALSIGDSVCVSGVCLTIVDLGPDSFQADVSRETLDVTTLGALRAGARVNLEPSLTLAQPLGGHLVTGHVDGVGRVASQRREARSWRFEFGLPDDLAHYVAAKGSITVDGVSLTVNAVAADRFEVNIIPHTYENTIFSGYRAGTEVNIEVDIVARYIERLIGAGDPTQ